MKINIVHKKDFFADVNIRKSLRSNVVRIARDVSIEEKINLGSLSLIFCDDDFIKEHNKKYLGHDYATDIITFHDKDDSGRTEGDLLISVDTVRTNSERFKTDFENELMRVIIHGLLHLCGYDDSTSSEKKLIREKENYYLKKYI